MNNNQIEQIFKSRGFSDYKFLNPKKDITVTNWVRFKCMFGCKSYGKCSCCPPAVPSVEECQKMINEYSNGVIIHFPIKSQELEEKQKMITDLLDLEREIFLAGYHKTFLLPHHIYSSFCNNCDVEGSRVKCTNKFKSRPSPEAMGIDVFQTARDAGYTIEVVKDHNDIQNRFSFILIE